MQTIDTAHNYVMQNSYRAASIRVVGRNEKSKLEQSSLIEPSPDHQQAIPDCRESCLN